MKTTKHIPSKHQPSEAQVAYMAAKALKLVTERAYNEAKAELWPIRMSSDEEIDAHYAMLQGLEESTGYGPARMALLQAELNLVAWAEGVVKTDPKTAHKFGLVADVFTKGMRSPAIRPKLIDVCARLSA